MHPQGSHKKQRMSVCLSVCLSVWLAGWLDACMYVRAYVTYYACIQQLHGYDNYMQNWQHFYQESELRISNLIGLSVYKLKIFPTKHENA